MWFRALHARWVASTDAGTPAVAALTQRSPHADWRTPQSTERILREREWELFVNHRSRANRARKSPARFPGRAHFVSFNFLNGSIYDSSQQLPTMVWISRACTVAICGIHCDVDRWVSRRAQPTLQAWRAPRGPNDLHDRL